jgi:fatty-acyl-CoA synthase
MTTPSTATAHEILWPKYDDPSDLEVIEKIPLAERGLPATTYGLLARAADLWPARVAVTVLPDADRWEQPVCRTYSELLTDVHRAANQLHGHGVRRDDAVALLSPNCADLITATLAAELAGIAAPINPGLSSAHISELLERSGARVLVVAGPDLDAGAWQTALALATAGAVHTLLALRPTDPSGATQLDAVDGVTVEYLGSGPDLPDTHFVGTAPGAQDLASVFHTGGTTGVPKLAGHTHANEVTDAWMIAANTSLEDESVVFAALPLFHVNALVVTLLAPLFKGQRVLWAGPLGYRDFALYGCLWKIVEHYRVAAMSAVPTVYSVLAKCPVDADISSLRFAMVGASALPPAVREGFESHTGVPLVEGYGLTEATCASARSFPGAPRPGSVGQRLPYQEVKVVRIDEAGAWHDLPTGEVGVLAISGPTVFPGYVTGRDALGRRLDGLGKLVDGWLDTGDLARVDEEGFIYLTGRAKDLIIRGGHNIDPAVIEDVLLSHPAVSGASAVGRPDVHAGEVPVAYVVTDGSVTVDQLSAWAADRIAEQAAVPKSIVVVEALPITDVGKPYKLALRARATEDAVTKALSGVEGVAAITAAVIDGSVVAFIALDDPAAHSAVATVLNRFAIAWEVTSP